MAGADVAAPASSALITIQFPLVEKEKETGFLVTRRLGRGGKILFFSLKNSRQSNEIKGKTRSRTNERTFYSIRFHGKFYGSRERGRRCSLLATNVPCSVAREISERSIRPLLRDAAHRSLLFHPVLRGRKESRKKVSVAHGGR